MGLDPNGARFLIQARNAGVRFDRTLTLGRQWLFIAFWDARRLFYDLPSERPLITPDGYADTFLRALGAADLHAMDASAYEQADIIHDLNHPVPEAMKGRFDVVLDAGSMEHVFNFPQALKNAMEMVNVGGRLFLISPTNNQCGHGFYQMSPELFYRALSPENGYQIERMYAYEWGTEKWFSVARPEVVRARVELCRGSQSVSLLVQAIRNANVPIFKDPPQQSDYVVLWDGGQSSRRQSALSKWMDARLPLRVVQGMHKIVNGSRNLRNLLRNRGSLKDTRFFSSAGRLGSK
jgi:SAM-dependent methyltransferase